MKCLRIALLAVVLIFGASFAEALTLKWRPCIEQEGWDRTIDFSIPDEWMEFNITFSKENADDNIAITGIEVHSIEGPAVIYFQISKKTTTFLHFDDHFRCQMFGSVRFSF